MMTDYNDKGQDILSGWGVAFLPGAVFFDENGGKVKLSGLFSIDDMETMIHALRSNRLSGEIEDLDDILGDHDGDLLIPSRKLRNAVFNLIEYASTGDAEQMHLRAVALAQSETGNEW